MNKDLFENNAGAEFVQPESAITAKTPITWTVVENLNELPEKDDAFLGRVYSIEFDDGSVKIGSSSQCKNRISCIVTCSGLYGLNRAVRFAYSSPHIEYHENEKMLHRTFAEQHFAGRNREIFRVKIEDVIMQPIFGSTDTSEHEKNADRIAEFGKKMILEGTMPHLHNAIRYKNVVRSMLNDPENAIMLLDAERKRLEDKAIEYMKAIGFLYELIDNESIYDYVKNESFLQEIVDKMLQSDIAQ